MIRLKWAIHEVDRRSLDGEGTLLAVSRHVGVVPRQDFTDRQSRSESLEGYKKVLAGDLVVNTMRAFNGALGVAPRDGLVSPAYSVLKVAADFEPRYLAYLLRSDWGLGEIAKRIRGIGLADQGNVRTPTLSAGDLGQIAINPPVRDQQRAIADYLDRETARIDALIDKKQRQSLLQNERFLALVSMLLFQRAERWTTIGRSADLLAGNAFSSDDFALSGIRLLRGINVEPGQIRWDETVFLSESDAVNYRRFELALGDIVIGMDRPIVASGLRVAFVSQEDLPALLLQRVLRVRSRSSVLDARILRFIVSSSEFAQHLAPIVTGVSVPHVSEEQIARFRVPLYDLDIQRAIAEGLVEGFTSLTEVKDRLTRQIDLLREKRQALITTAVSGQIPSPGAA